MGGDFGPRITVPATLDTLRQHPTLKVVLFGDSDQIKLYLSNQPDINSQRCRIQHCDSSVAMDEKPSFAVRHHQDSSLWQMIKLVSEGEADAGISAGNTGALMAMSLIQLKTLPSISRPAICTKIPTATGYTHLLDLGANVTCTAEQLYQFGMMASEAVSAINGYPRPTVGLLNIGVEAIKGRQEILAAAELLKSDKDINYVGFVEGDSLFKGLANIVVCDGFSGNVALKTSEGVAVMLQGFLQQALSETFLTKIAALLARPALNKLQQRIDPSQYNGASLLGLKSVVIKSHGGATQQGFHHALSVAIAEAERGLPALIESRLSQKIS